MCGSLDFLDFFPEISSRYQAGWHSRDDGLEGRGAVNECLLVAGKLGAMAKV